MAYYQDKLKFNLNVSVLAKDQYAKPEEVFFNFYQYVPNELAKHHPMVDLKPYLDNLEFLSAHTLDLNGDKYHSDFKLLCSIFAAGVMDYVQYLDKINNWYKTGQLVDLAAYDEVKKIKIDYIIKYLNHLIDLSVHKEVHEHELTLYLQEGFPEELGYLYRCKELMEHFNQHVSFSVPFNNRLLFRETQQTDIDTSAYWKVKAIANWLLNITGDEWNRGGICITPKDIIQYGWLIVYSILHEANRTTKLLFGQ